MHDEDIPVGLCQCGCGRRTSIARHTKPERGLVRGQPVRFISGHNRAIPAHERALETDPRTCSHCKVTKQTRDFSPQRNGRYQRKCKACCAEYAKQYLRDNPEASAGQRAARLKRTYGISADEFEAMLLAQDGVCAVCRSAQKWGHSQSLHIDHDHATGRVRGILCHKCNVALGMVGDSVERLRALIDYLEAL